jgi:hypothetical protein
VVTMTLGPAGRAAHSRKVVFAGGRTAPRWLVFSAGI